jgi:hypothetical protein
MGRAKKLALGQRNAGLGPGRTRLWSMYFPYSHANLCPPRLPAHAPLSRKQLEVFLVLATQFLHVHHEEVGEGTGSNSGAHEVSLAVAAPSS